MEVISGVCGFILMIAWILFLTYACYKHDMYELNRKQAFALAGVGTVVYTILFLIVFFVTQSTAVFLVVAVGFMIVFIASAMIFSCYLWEHVISPHILDPLVEAIKNIEFLKDKTEKDQ